MNKLVIILSQCSSEVKEITNKLNNDGGFVVIKYDDVIKSALAFYLAQETKKEIKEGGFIRLSFSDIITDQIKQAIKNGLKEANVVLDWYPKHIISMKRLSIFFPVTVLVKLHSDITSVIADTVVGVRMNKDESCPPEGGINSALNAVEMNKLIKIRRHNIEEIYNKFGKVTYASISYDSTIKDSEVTEDINETIK